MWRGRAGWWKEAYMTSRNRHGMKPGPRVTSTIKGSKKGVAQGLLHSLSLFEGSVPSEQIKVCNWVPTSDCIKVEPLQASASQQKTLDLIDLLKSRKFALQKVTHCSMHQLPRMHGTLRRHAYSNDQGHRCDQSAIPWNSQPHTVLLKSNQ